MSDKFKDTDLREALRRKYADTPQLPADFMAGMEQQMDAKPRRRINGWLLRVACLLILIGVGTVVLMEDKEPLPSEPRHVEENTWVQPQTHSPLKRETAATKPTVSRKETTSFPGGNYQFPGRKLPAPSVQTPALEPEDEAINLHYVADVTQEDTTAYQDPARMDEFIAKLAEFNEVKAVLLDCSSDLGNSIGVSMAYVFEDRQKLDLFARLLQAACWYDSKTPGYQLNFSRQQFFFTLKDLRKGEKYIWITERLMDGRILLFSTHSPIEVPVSLACYQTFLEQLTNTNNNLSQF
ncbi:MAG: hypothetical protein IJ569_04850 [Prevotella sp.]|nr:hypothetical protein [Prevotella sp.]